MNPTSSEPSHSTGSDIENIVYVHQMLGELRHVAHGDGAEMLRYLIEMAYVEAADLISAERGNRQNDFKARRSVGSVFE